MINFVEWNWVYEKDRSEHWISVDNEENFAKALEAMPENWHYGHKQITYDLNSQGFRNLEFDQIDWNNSIVVVGSSQVFGLGLASEETLCGRLREHYGKKYDVVNLGMIAGSNRVSMINLSKIYAQGYKPVAVVFMWTALLKFPYYGDDNRIVPTGFWSCLEDANPHIREWYTNRIKHVAHYVREQEYYPEIIRAICGDSILINASFFCLEKAGKSIFLTTESLPSEVISLEIVDYSRDLNHPGPKSNAQAYAQIVKLLTESGV